MNRKRKYHKRYNPFGEKAHNWKGGRKINSQGYVLIYSPNHPNKDQQGYVREHRLVMEKYLDRYLNKNEVIHHINRIKNDNTIENLEVISKVEHDRISSFNRIRNFQGRFL